MQQDRSSGYVVQPLIDVQPAMSAGEDKGNGFQARREEIVKDAIEPAAEPREPRTAKRRAGGSGRPSSPAGVAGRVEPLRSIHPEFRTEVAVGEVIVTGVLSGTARPQVGGSVAISGDVHRLSSDQALELVDALLLVVTRMDVVAEQRCGATTNATRDRED